MILNDDLFELYAVMCKTISKPTRLKILHYIGTGKANVSDMHKALNVSMSSLSNHLNDLYRAGVLTREKQGNFVYYSLSEPGLLEVIDNMQNIIKKMSSRLAVTQS
ncbi:MAG: winged helix-turn-helix transcriptional regulator [Candidatus Aminicenantes bacterium]|nr:winged helix-turn-helix transcriptional regulator [Candidatus Aminicenantes bacterium]